ncbi:hypothetical protein Trydic_g8432 [Trypoxylus dichotomus]
MEGKLPTRRLSRRMTTQEEPEVSIERKSTGASALEGDPIDLVMQELGRIKDNSSREVNGKLSFTRANQQAIRDGCGVVAEQMVRVLKESRTIERTLMSEKCRLVEELAELKVEMARMAKEGGEEKVKSKKEEDAAEIRKKLAQRLPVEEIGSFKYVRKTGKGDPLVESRNAEQKEKLRKRIGSMDSLTADEPTRRGKRVNFTGVDKGHKAETLKQAIWEQNGAIRKVLTEERFKEGMRPVEVRKCRNERKENWIVEVGEEVYAALKKCGGQVVLDLISVYVEDWVYVVRCFKCCGYGHTSRTCRGKEVCAQCGGEHRSGECKEKKRDCPMCKRVGATPRAHSAMDFNCPQYQRRLEIEKQRRQ